MEGAEPREEDTAYQASLGDQPLYPYLLAGKETHAQHQSLDWLQIQFSLPSRLKLWFISKHNRDQEIPDSKLVEQRPDFINMRISSLDLPIYGFQVPRAMYSCVLSWYCFGWLLVRAWHLFLVRPSVAPDLVGPALKAPPTNQPVKVTWLVSIHPPICGRSLAQRSNNPRSVFHDLPELGRWIQLQLASWPFPPLCHWFFGTL